MSDQGRKPNIHQCACPEQCATKPHKWRLWLMRYGSSEIFLEFDSWAKAMNYGNRAQGWQVEERGTTDM